MEYIEMEAQLRATADEVAASARDWSAAEVAERLRQIADQLREIRLRHQTGINASMGKRSGSTPEEV